MTEPSYTPSLSPFGTGLACRCPRCGKGRLFQGYLTIAERCGTCGLDLDKANTGDGPAVFIIFILGALVVPLALLVESRFEPPMWVHLMLWPPAILGGALGLLRPMKGVMIALQFHNKASDSGTVDYD